MAIPKATYTAVCPECDSTVTFGTRPQVEQIVICKSCEAMLEVVDDDPIELMYAFEEEDYEDDDFDEDLDYEDFDDDDEDFEDYDDFDEYDD